jgi:hypothetical protein
LLSELAQRSDVRFYDERLAVVKHTEDVCEQLALTIAAGLPTGPEDAEWRAIWRAVLAAGFELDQRRDVQHIYHRQVKLYARILSAGQKAGEFPLRGPARDVAMTLMSMEDYLGYRIVARDPDLSRETALRLMRSYAELATGGNASYGGVTPTSLPRRTSSTSIATCSDAIDSASVRSTPSLASMADSRL